jgi:alpha-amylase/alpha-mannosidase (GH57 family)
MDVVIHGHFYQPPRENPWSGLIPRQESAYPAHDWNERVTDECYRPNARSRVLGKDNLIEEIVNNYAFINFDFGPTLLSWLTQYSPRIYQQIIEGDRISVKLHQGHGNAIAHVYNHIIMPLANYRDKRTQIIWGLRDFEWRFGRKSESIWLSETAINLETVKLLIEFGIRYVILSPYQALRSRPLDRSRSWTDGTGGKIDPRRAYRFYLKDARRRRIKSRYIDVFFYDGQLASDISFGHLLQSADKLAQRVKAGWGGLGDDPGLVNIATDGEIYGHHEPFADMCLSYVIRRMAKTEAMRFTNYGSYLDRHPPEHEVDINFGEHDEGTAWSCAHGVGRWERDCGCSTGAQAGWNQHWRTPLRRGFDMVRDRLVETYLEQASQLVKDPWLMRDDYILMLLDGSADARRAFLDQHSRQPLSAEERQRIWRLLESQRYAMYMYTSCAWFFADISGIETVQNMAYARRAIELARPWQSLDLEKMMLEYFAEAQSNVPGLGSGADVYERYVLPQRIPESQVAGGLALGAAVQKEPPEDSRFMYAAETLSFVSEALGSSDSDGVAYHGRIDLTNRITEEQLPFEVHVYPAGPAEYACYVWEFDGSADRMPEKMSEAKAKTRSDGHLYRLQDLVAENQEWIINTAYESILTRQDDLLKTLFNEGKNLIQTCQGAQVPVPAVLSAVAGHVLSRELKISAERLERHMLARLTGSVAADGDEASPLELALADIADQRQFAAQNGIEISDQPVIEAFGRILLSLLEKLLKTPDVEIVTEFLAVIRTAFRFQIPLDRRPLEDLTYLVLGKHRTVLGDYRTSATDSTEGRSWILFKELADALQLNINWIIQEPNQRD